MPRTKLAATQTTEVKTALKIQPKAIKMLLERVEEDARLSREIKERKERKSRLQAEVEEICKKEKLSGKLLEGFDIEGNKFKMIAGNSTKWDVKKMVEAGLDPDDYRESVPKKAYVKMTRAGEKGGDED